jgi:hypothetical protein
MDGSGRNDASIAELSPAAMAWQRVQDMEIRLCLIFIACLPWFQPFMVTDYVIMLW